jgi:hypothetical protein
LLPFADLDPARGVTASMSPFTDEGANVVNARNLVLFGSWTTDAWTLHLLNGPFSLLQALVFSIFGIGLVQARLIAIVAVAASGGLLAAGIARNAARTAAAIAAIAFVTSSLALYYGRLAYVEPLAGLFLVSGFLTIPPAAGERRPTGSLITAGVVGGVAFGAAVATKAVVTPLVLTAVVAVGILALRDRGLWPWLLGALVGLAAAAMAWLIVVWIPHAADVTAMVDHVLPRLQIDLTAAGLARAAGYFLGRGDDRAILWSLPLLVGALVGIGAELVRTIRLRAAPSPRHVAAAAALAAGVGALATIEYHPNRYIVPLLPVAAILVAPAVAAVGETAARIVPDGRAARAVAASVVSIALAGPGTLAYARWIADGTRELPSAMAAAVDVIPPGAVVVGHYAPIVALDTRAVTIIPCCGADPVNGGDLYTERGARFLIRGADPATWTPAPPSVIAVAETMFCLTWGQPAARTCLVRLP